MYVLLETESKRGTWTVNVLIYSLQSNAIKESVLALQEFIRENYEDAVVEVIQNKDTFAETVSAKSYDIVYYDISGRGSKEDVTEELQSFRLQSPECDILLMAETEEYAIVGYKVHAYDYIILSEEEDEEDDTSVRKKRKVSHGDEIDLDSIHEVEEDEDDDEDEDWGEDNAGTIGSVRNKNRDNALVYEITLEELMELEEV